MRRRDIAGQRFGRLTAISRETATKPCGQKFSLWLCRCDCGNNTRASLGDITTGNTTSCGCYAAEVNGASSRTHGKSKGSRAYQVWLGIRARCTDKKNKAYANYGGRGITICERWASFENFFSDMGEPPSGMQIERKNNDGQYSPKNCVWATVAEQSRNRRSNIVITIGGRSLCLLDWCIERGLPYPRVRARIKVLGWTPQRALEVRDEAKHS